MTSLATLIDAAARRYGERTALVAGSRRLTYGEVEERAGALAHELDRLGVGPGVTVALSCPNVPEFTIAYWAILKAGGVVVPLSTLLRAREIAFHLDDSCAAVHLVYDGPEHEGLVDTCRVGAGASLGNASTCLIGSTADGLTMWQGRPVAAPALTTRERADDDTAVILYTSGTTGRPKGAELTQANLRSNAQAAAAVYALAPERPDTYLLAVPLFHALGQTCIQNAGTAHGATVVMMARFSASEALRLVSEEAVTIFAGVPTMYWALLRALDDNADQNAVTGRLRVAASGGAALPAELHCEIQARLGVTVLEGYGLSETSPMASHTLLHEPVRVGSIGRPVAGVAMKLIAPDSDDWVDVPDIPDAVGEIAISGPNVMKGYYGRPEADRAVLREGWFRTGDLGRRDADGYFYIVGRSKDVIIRGGYNVYPREVEEVLIEHPAVSLVAVVGTSDLALGQDVKAVVVKSAGHEAVTEDQLVDWGREQLAAHKYPRIVEFREALPMTASGKILKRDLA